MTVEKILVPDIGGSEAEVIEILVKPGDQVAIEDALLTMEGEKATMDVPSPVAGTIKAIEVNVGDKLSEGQLIVTIETAVSSGAAVEEQQSAAESDASTVSSSAEHDLSIPDLGDSAQVDVIEVAVKVGDSVNKEEALLTLEGDKATMDVPAPYAGKITALTVKVGAKVSSGDVIGKIETTDSVPKQAAKTATATATTEKKSPQTTTLSPASQVSENNDEFSFGTDIHAGPAVRRIAREFGVNLRKVRPTGIKQRVTKEDVQQYVKQQMKVAESGGGGAGLQLLPQPKVDFSKFGAVTTQPLSKIKKISGANLHRNWVSIPHVTQFDEADITEMEAFRQEQKSIAAAQGIKLTPLVFIMKAVVAALKQFPIFNASLAHSGEELVLKQYYHIGVAVDTPNGLVVPVIRDVDKKGLYELATELGAISKKARETGLSMAEMQGGCFTISSLGGIGGTAFTPIINAPEVAILGVSKSSKKPVYLPGKDSFVPRLMLPLCLSYDHRVVDGADGARFITFLSSRLSDMRTILL